MDRSICLRCAHRFSRVQRHAAAYWPLKTAYHCALPAFANINELFEAHGEVAERIDVIKGPASALYGSNAIHGVINVITPDTTQGTVGASLWITAHMVFTALNFNKAKTLAAVAWVLLQA